MPRPRFRQLAVATALVFGSVLLTVLAVLAADRLLARVAGDPRLTAGLIFPPQVEIAVKTYEYTYTVKTNNIGLRDEPYDEGRRPKILVAAIGDSFTFGQGVNLADTWVQRVEANLRGKGLDIEILNLGQPGSSPREYAELAEEALPILKPDLVLIGMLQVDDLHQVDPDPKAEAAVSREPRPRTWARTWFPALSNWAYYGRAQLLADRERRSHGNWSLVRARWQDDFRRAYNQFAEDEGAAFTFMSLPTPIQEAFRNGEIPPIIARACSVPFRMEWAAISDWKIGDPEMQPRITRAGEYLQRVANVIRPWNGRAAVVTLPFLVLNDPFGVADLHRLFGNSTPAGASDSRADDAIRAAADLAGLPCHDVSEAFRAMAHAEPLYYPLDSHMTARGNAVYAELITPVIEQYARDIPNR